MSEILPGNFLEDEAEFVQRVTEGKVENSEIFEMCEKVMEILSGEPFLLNLSSEITVVGDLHGQYFDLLNILKLLNSSKYLFLGDFVDRGANSVETTLILFRMKILYPESVFILRGNHESSRISSMYGFKEECIRSYRSVLVWEKFCSVFDFLPVCAVIDRKIFGVHGGIGPRMDLGSVNSIMRVKDVPVSGEIANFLWSDPDPSVSGFVESKRGAGYYFGEDEVDEFLAGCGLERIIRSHQLVDKGYKEDFSGKVVTVWSALNYCYRCMNKATVAKISNGEIEFVEIPVVEKQRRETKILSYFL